MKTVLTACKPRQELFGKSLPRDLFAANLYQVVAGTAPEIYADPRRFFDNTYPTEGLRILLREVFGRITGADRNASPIIRLETAFGGGKTHSLIALYHIAHAAAKIPHLDRLLPIEYQPRSSIRPIILYGAAYAPTGTRQDGRVRPKTLWGELALQAGGDEGYALIKEADELRSAPGTALLKKVLGNTPTIVLLDEIAEYLVKTSEVRSHGETLAKHTVAFLQELFDVASELGNLTIVLALATRSDAYGDQTEAVLSTIRESQNVTVRNSKSLTPTDEGEISEVLKRRLFESVDPEAAQEAAEWYLQLYREEEKRGTVLPLKATRPTFKADLAKSYPFHPELIDLLNRKLGTIQNFQKTRGALRLLALTIRDIWQKKQEATFMMPYHMDLANTDIQDELTGRLDKGVFLPVIQNDINSKKGDARAQELDEAARESGKPPLATWLATTIFLNSLVSGQPGGVDAAGLNLAILGPNARAEQIEKALGSIVDTCWFLYDTGNKYVFQTEWNINKAIAEEIGNIGITEAKQHVEALVEQQYAKKYFDLRPFPDSPSGVPNDAQEPKLAVMHWDSECVEDENASLPELVVKIYEETGQKKTFREYRNNVLFLVADCALTARMIEVAKRTLALRNIHGNRDLTSGLSKDQRNRLDEKYKTSGLEAVEAIITTYRHLYYPSVTGDITGTVKLPLRHYTISVDKAADVRKDQQSVLLETLVGLNKVLKSDDDPLDPEYVKQNVWRHDETNLTTLELKRRFAQKPSLPIILDPDMFKRIIQKGVEKGAWVYQKGRTVYEKGSPPVPIQLDEDGFLFTPAEARKRGITAAPPKVEERQPGKCPLCQQDPCVCRVEVPDVLEAEGDVQRTFKSLTDQAADKKVDEIEVLQLTVTNAKDAKAVSLLIPRLGKAETRIEQTYAAREEGQTEIDLTYKGDWEHYKRVREFVEGFDPTITPSLEASFRILFPEPLKASPEGVKKLVDGLKSLDIGSISLRAYPPKARAKSG
jgi:predicted AAA+ superfamily ATPase